MIPSDFSMCFEPNLIESRSEKSDWIHIHRNPFSGREHPVSSCAKKNRSKLSRVLGQEQYLHSIPTTDPGDRTGLGCGHRDAFIKERLQSRGQLLAVSQACFLAFLTNHQSGHSAYRGQFEPTAFFKLPTCKRLEIMLCRHSNRRCIGLEGLDDREPASFASPTPSADL